MAAHLEGAILQGVNLSKAFLIQANFNRAMLHSANFSGAFLNPKTTFNGADLHGCKIERFQLELLHDYGGLSKGDLNDMDIEDGVVTLRAAYSGFMQWIHFIALSVFLFPYVWFVVSQWSLAKFNFGTESHMPLWEALRNFIYNGGINWQSGPALHWSFGVFVFMLLSNFLRGLLLWKTKTLENYQDASGLRARFSLQSTRVQLLKWDLSFLRWGHLHNLAQTSFYVAIVLALLNTWHFFTQEIPVYLP